MSQAYSAPKRASDPHALPNVEVFQHYPTEHRENGRCDFEDDDGECLGFGFYWQSCFPGCLPDGEPIGPFETEAEALADAQEGSEDDA